MYRTFTTLKNSILLLLLLLGINIPTSWGQTYCTTYPLDSDYEWITNVTFAGINNTTSASSTGYADYTTGTIGNVTVGQAYTLSVSIVPDSWEYIYAFIDWNNNGILDNAGEVYNVASNVSGYGPYTISITPPATANLGNTRMRIMLDYDDLNMGDPCTNMSFLYYDGYGEVEDYTINVQSNVSITSLTVSTQNNASPTINTNAGTLQMNATILPATANQSVTWSIVPVTGTANISTSGLVTGVANGTVWAKAVSVQDATKKDSLLITLSNQTPAITNITVSTIGNASPTITTNGGTLSLQSVITPSYANQAVTWSITPGTGNASISTNGVVTAITNGTVWAKATSVEDVTKKDSLLINISNQVVNITSIAVSTQNNVPAIINTNGGTLQLNATILPATVSQAVTWQIIPITGTANISSNGLVTPTSNGTVWAKATSIANNTMRDSIQITISNQIVIISSLVVTTANNATPTINTNVGTLQMNATVLPIQANQVVVWSIVPVTGAATISNTGLVTAVTNGTVWAKATSNSDATKKDSVLITITNQIIPVTDLVVNTLNFVPANINTANGTLQMTATVTPANASQIVIWSIIPVSGSATISNTGLVTATSNGTVWAKAVSVTTPNKKDSILITITNQVIAVTSLNVNVSNNQAPIIDFNNGTLALTSTILPSTANQSVTWSIIPNTGDATINNTGVVTAVSNGTVWAKATSVQNPLISDSISITISNQIIPISDVIIATANNAAPEINVNAGTLQMTASVYPSNANQNVTWEIVPNTGTASVDNNGLITAITNGTVWVKASSLQNPSISDSLLITIKNQINLGVADISENNINVYPNPATEYINIEMKASNKENTIRIIDINGRVVKNLESKESKVKMDISDLTPNNYFIIINENESRYIIKLIKL